MSEITRIVRDQDLCFSIAHYALGFLKPPPTALMKKVVVRVEDMDIWNHLPLGSYTLQLPEGKLLLEIREFIPKHARFGEQENLEAVLTLLTKEGKTPEECDEILGNFLEKAALSCGKGTPAKVRLFRDGCWYTATELAPREFNSIYLPGKEKEVLVQDLTLFLEEKEEYHRLGMPYKRCYLFHGPPGCGKSSTIRALAHRFNRSLYVLNISQELSDSAFLQAVMNVKTKEGVLVLEDLDSSFSTYPGQVEQRVTLSSVLNVLDGVYLREDLLVFITANSLEFLPEKLLRPGRIDFKMQFFQAKEEQIQEMWNRMLPGKEGEFPEFHSLLKGKKINMGLVQKFLFKHRKENPSLFEAELWELLSEQGEEKSYHD